MNVSRPLAVGTISEQQFFIDSIECALKTVDKIEAANSGGEQAACAFWR
jgi:hypothetical protein